MEKSINAEIQELQLKLENAENYNHYLSDLYDNVRGFKHDFDNIINCIGGYIKSDDMDGLKKYFSKFEKDSNNLKKIGFLNPNTINNPAIYNLITSKYEKAKSYNIDFNLDIFLDFNNINMSIYEFSRILGILLDNAIEAAKDCEIKIINASVREAVKQNVQIISIENSYSNNKIDKNKIFQKGISTKENHSGLGLWEVNKIVNHNENVILKTIITEDFFKQEIQIY